MLVDEVVEEFLGIRQGIVVVVGVDSVHLRLDTSEKSQLIDVLQGERHRIDRDGSGLAFLLGLLYQRLDMLANGNGHGLANVGLLHELVGVFQPART